MSKVIENYVLHEIVGSGQYGKVYRAKNMKNEEIVAIKVIPLNKFKEVPKLTEFTMNEIQTLSKIENTHVIKFLEMLKTSNNMYLVYEFCNGETLEHVINKKTFLSEKESLVYLKQMLVAFKSLIKYNILHRDLKPSNILFHDEILKIADFGFCKTLLSQKDMTSTMVGSPIYMAPEILKGEQYTTKADIWSIGVVFFECLFGFCPYEEKNIAQLISKIDSTPFLQLPRHINNISAWVEDLLRKMLTVNWKDRIDWPQLFQMLNIQEQIPQNNFAKILQQNNNLNNQNYQTNNQQQHLQQQRSYSNSNNNNKFAQISNNNHNQSKGINLLGTDNNNNNNQQQQQNIKQNPQQLQILKQMIEKKYFINFGVNVLYNILDLNISNRLQTPIVAFLLIKSIWNYTSNLQIQLQSQNNNQLQQQYENSIEIKYFWEIVNREKLIIKNTLEYFKAGIFKLAKKRPELQDIINKITILQQNNNNNNNNNIMTSTEAISFNQNQFMLYLEELIEYSSNPQNQISIKKLQIHQNEILDFLIYYNNYLSNSSIEQKNIKQNYQEEIQNYEEAELQSMITQKFHIFKKQCMAF